MVFRSVEGVQVFNLEGPVKRRRALLASNPPRNSRSELIADDEAGRACTSRDVLRLGSGAAQREAAPGPRFTEWHRTDRFRHALENASSRSAGAFRSGTS